jgi:signal recognition particle subunit SRP54
MAIISSMTKKERKKPDILQASRKRRIAAGSGVDVAEVNRLLKQHRQMADAFKAMSKNGGKGLAQMAKMMGMGGPGGMGGGGMPSMPPGFPTSGAGMPDLDALRTLGGGKLPDLPGMGGGFPGLPGFKKK